MLTQKSNQIADSWIGIWVPKRLDKKIEVIIGKGSKLCINMVEFEVIREGVSMDAHRPGKSRDADFSFWVHGFGKKFPIDVLPGSSSFSCLLDGNRLRNCNTSIIPEV
jgi:hypothetical protein